MAAAVFGGRVMLSSLLTDFVCLCLPEPQQQLYRCQLTQGTRDGLQRLLRPLAGIFDAFVMLIPKIYFLLFVVFSSCSAVRCCFGIGLTFSRRLLRLR
jgi:hypothetical protein